MKPLIHAENSVKKWGGVVEDYLEIHNFLDQTKAHFPDMRHRAILHNSFGIQLGEQVFGVYITNQAGRKVSVRDVLEGHVIDDMGTIPTLQDYLQHLPMLPWLGGAKREKRKVTWDQMMYPEAERNRYPEHAPAEPHQDLLKGATQFPPRATASAAGPTVDPGRLYD